MRFFSSIIFVFLSVLSVFSQANSNWSSYYSYNYIVGLAEANNRIIASTENAIFSKHLVTGEITTFNSIDGLKSDEITAVYHSREFNITLVGNANGFLIVIRPDSRQIINKVDIVNDVPIVQSNKKINHFLEHNGKVYIATDYGVSVFNLETIEFGDTYFIGDFGQETKVFQTALYNNEIYAVTENNGIKRASLSNPFLINYNSWETFNSESWTGITSIGQHLVASKSNKILYKLNTNGTSLEQFNTNENILNIKSVNQYLTITTSSTIYVLSENLASVTQIGQFLTDETLEYTASSIIQNTLYIGTKNKGVYSIELNNTNVYQNHTPNGPLRNKVYSINATADNLWCVFGDNVPNNLSPFFPTLGRYGISKLTPEGWLHIPYKDVLQAANLSKIVTVPNNENQVYIGSNYSGILKIENDIPTHLFSSTNTGQNGLEGFTGGSSSDVRIHNMTFDRNNNIWVTNAGETGHLKVMRTDETWNSYVINPEATTYSDLIVDKNGTKWIATTGRGLYGFNEAYQNRLITIDNSYDEGIPINRVYTIAIDQNNRLWIGTLWGLRILPNVDRFLTETQPVVNPVIIIDDGLPQELLFQQTVRKIKIDGADRKWIGTLGSGVFLVSPNGQETIFHFTKDNSPLPSDFIIDIDINPKTGEVFFATDKGMVSYKGTSTQAYNNLRDVYVYPNPVRPEYAGTVKIAGLTDAANVKITDIEGNLVYETKSSGGTIEWNTTAFGKYKVASGVYMIFITSEDATETTVKKVMIIR